jgi:hypothetical protein
MTKESKIFFSVIILSILISAGFGFRSIILNNDFAVFIQEDDIPESSIDFFN